MKKEIWQDIKGYEGYYQISNKGRLKVLGAYIKNLGNFANGYLKKVNIKEIAVDRNGYCITKLCRDGKCRPRKIHRLVAQAFLPNPKNLPQVNHIDGNKENNSVENLEWISARDNIIHAWETGLKNNDHLKGSNSPHAKLTEEQVIEIRRLYDNKIRRYSELLKDYPMCSADMLKNIIKRRTWKHIP